MNKFLNGIFLQACIITRCDEVAMIALRWIDLTQEIFQFSYFTNNNQYILLNQRACRRLAVLNTSGFHNVGHLNLHLIQYGMLKRFNDVSRD